ASDASTFYADSDSDGYGDASAPILDCTQPSGTIVDGSDCDDTDGAINPDAAETCDGVDNNCSGDENDASDATTYYADLDADFFGDVNNTFAACDRPNGYRTNAEDCDDGDAAVNPNAAETCDGTDNNCSGDESDASDASTWFADTDGDGYGDTLFFANACNQPSGYLADDSDCNDADNTVNPGETETCDGTDNNCSGDELDAIDVLTFYADTDSDGYGDAAVTSAACSEPSGYLADDSDCNDADNTVNPGEAETCDGTDNNCSGDENDASDATTFYADSDEDTFGDSDVTFVSCDQPSGYITDSTDCDDGENTTYPGAPEVCSDGVDSDCDTIDSMGTCDANLSGADASFSGVSVGDLAGYHMTGGDINGDGFSDVVVGARLVHNGGTDRGSTYVVFGPVTGNLSLSSADAELTGEADNDYSGGSVASGDFNNDGFDDMVVGALNEDAGGTDAGAAYVVLGPVSGALSLSSADLKLTGTGAGDQAGKSVAAVGDVDDDGNDDFLISGYKNDDAAANAGAAYLFYGPATSGDLSTADAILQGVSAQDYAGSWVSAAGDVDGDGFDDVLVGAYRADIERDSITVSNVGITYLMHGPLSGTVSLSTANASFIGEASNDQSGSQVSEAGDVNNDGFADFLIGAERSDVSKTGDDGRAYLLLGPLSGAVELSAANAIFEGENGNDRAGRGIGAAGDLDGDGFDDLLIGAKENDGSGTGAGAAYVVLGPITGTLSLSAADAIYGGETAGDQAGIWMSGAGDVSGDGSPDFLVGGNSASSGAGATYLILGDSWR
ncbi:MAG: MopE-related protein, partial [Myxococcota bacterium]|nr:MopE-related protein [Myxococcota bacterium]